ncbi:DUF4011 domain-containing protein [Corynebacterium pyruviciproducens]|uniref:DUF4011 domain-containing protein n=1 Tax=Corynebacterium pyruviciproducens TaxID=598660 RepID=UPI00254FA70B|nr:DUF4011 domain-containing protein [Corynebacterium pyruviciproducens]MDK6565564.1 DUF4011 domain-containing protein [Corynebacterium pyruviciproducens]
MFQFDVFEFTSRNLQGELQYRNGTNYALAHNRIPVAYSLTIKNQSEEVQPEFSVSLECKYSGEDLFPPFTTHIPSLGPYEQHSINLTGATRPRALLMQEMSESDLTQLRIIIDNGVEQFIHHLELRILAYNEWFNSPLFFESLSAFVQPNDRKLAPILHRASEILEKQTGSSSLETYQSGSKRAVETAAAIFSALREKHIAYSNPPASFENTGQRVRTSSEVIAALLGTCIDLSVTFSAAAEQVGLHPVIILLRGHAMAGIITRDKTFRPSVIENSATMHNLITGGEVLPIESTLLTSDEPKSFDEAVTQAQKTLDSAFATETVYGIIDITATRRNGIYPLNSVYGDHDDQSITSEAVSKANFQPFGKLDDLIYYGDGDASNPRLRSENVPPRVATWMRELLDLTFKNRLLNMRPSAEVIELFSGGGLLADLDDLIHNGTILCLEPNDALSQNQRAQGYQDIQEIEPEYRKKLLLEEHLIFAGVTENQYKNKLTKLRRAVTTLQEETGSNNLYLALGTILIPRTGEKNPAVAPLFLVPIKFTGGKGDARFGIVIDSSQDATPNHCLVEWLRQEHNISIPALEEPFQDDSGLDISRNLSEISNQLAESSLDLHITENSAILIAKFSTYGMWKDLRDNWREFDKSPVFHHLTFKPGQSFNDPAGSESLEDIKVKEEETFLPINADGAQLRAITAAAEGRSFVLEGPPGTGKSQTITNLVAHCLSQGQKVLFVAEKQAALDVVKSRLNNIGLAPFSLDLHGSDQNPEQLKHKLRRSIEMDLRYDEKTWNIERKRFQSRIEPLIRYPQQVHSPNGIGDSLWDAASQEIAYGEGPRLNIPRTYVRCPSIEKDALKKEFHELALMAQNVSEEEVNSWSLVGPEIEQFETSVIDEAFEQLGSAHEAISTNTIAADIARHFSPDYREKQSQGIKRILSIPAELKLTAEQRGNSKEILASLAKFISDADLLVTETAPVATAFSSLFIKSGNIEELIAAGEEAQKGLFGKKKRLKHFYDLCSAAGTPSFSLSLMGENPPQPEQILGLARKIDLIRKAEAEFQDNLSEWAITRHLAKTPVATGEASQKLRLLSEQIEFQAATAKQWPEIIDSDPNLLAQAIPLVDNYYSAWNAFLRALTTTDEQLETWLDGKPWSVQLDDQISKLEGDFKRQGVSTLRNVSRWNSLALPLLNIGFEEAVRSILRREVPASEIDMALGRGLAHESLEERVGAFKLENFNAKEKKEQISQLKEAVKRLQKEIKESLPARLLKMRNFRPGRLDEKTGQLRRSLESKRKRRSFRSLFNTYSEQILDITPCVLASPTSLAHFIDPTSANFDVVVFDEASQVTVEQAVGALGRAQTAVVVGDSKQMPPTRFGGSGQGEIEEAYDSDESADSSDVGDLESILVEAVESGFPRLWLTWHYRSKDESLIAFSNANYYDGNLASLPSPGNSTAEGVTVRRVNGLFRRDKKAAGKEHRTNPVEADAIVEEISRRLHDPSTAEESIGVVTFNVQQRDLILDRLEASADPLIQEHLTSDTDSIFVKNLENVQGDERDVILFSVAFSKTEDGSKMPLNFGPLTRKGGERRLNVAITRARKSVVMFVSFDPSEIDLSRTSSRGMADLRHYIEQAQQGSSDSQSNDFMHRISHSNDRIREALADRLRARGWIVETEYGLSSFKIDLAVRPDNDDRWYVAVILDGPRWNALPTVADRDLVPELLKSLMDWPSLVRVWLPEWIADPERVLATIEQQLHHAKGQLEKQDEKEKADRTRRQHQLEQKKSEAEEVISIPQQEEKPQDLEEPILRASKPEATGLPSSASPNKQESVSDAPLREVSTTIADEKPPADTRTVPETPNEDYASDDENGDVPGPITMPVEQNDNGTGITRLEYEKPVVRIVGSQDDFENHRGPARRENLEKLIEQTVNHYGPIAVSEIVSFVARSFGYARVGNKIHTRISSAIPAHLQRTEISLQSSGFLWPDDLDPKQWRAYRASSTFRNPAMIPLEEIINCIEYFTPPHLWRMGLTSELSNSLLPDVCAAFGIRRKSKATSNRINFAIQKVMEASKALKMPEPANTLMPAGDNAELTEGSPGTIEPKQRSESETAEPPRPGSVGTVSIVRPSTSLAKRTATGFAVVDLETTGLSAFDRVIEIGIVLTSLKGTIEGTYSTLINPGRAFSNSYVHNISEHMIANAPSFDEVADDIATRLDGRIFVAHNLAFDSRLLQQEFVRREMVVKNLENGYCTMTHSPHFLRNQNRSLQSALLAAGLTNEHAHSALDDAVATAKLLGVLLRKGAIADKMPAIEVRTHATPRRTPTVTREFVKRNEHSSWISQIVEQLPLTGDADIDQFLQLLDSVMLDREVSNHEQQDLHNLAKELGLSQTDFERARMQYLRQVIRIALSDSVLTDSEIADINRVAEVLEIDQARVSKMMQEIGTSNNSLERAAFRLRPEDRVTFTGETTLRSRHEWEEIAANSGLVVAGLAKSTVLLVAADPDTMSDKAKKARRYKIPIVNEEGFERLLLEMKSCAEDY